jgi:hypothetical protein
VKEIGGINILEMPVMRKQIVSLNNLKGDKRQKNLRLGISLSKGHRYERRKGHKDPLRLE